eukprot:CAMPEP_0177793984 /NCGR_PEP_ID=MMETSP0491_2-20121128/25387_1 /TAXON_ID=63592 /ORGANISM="Tetraselmis chuii, Strain PLY429" /LENGTH=142 /DNA_ID=CAMNT_0019316577 /DNA_START=92 /DNA_END=520 /DNA_ORIENTATION=+
MPIRVNDVVELWALHRPLLPEPAAALCIVLLTGAATIALWYRCPQHNLTRVGDNSGRHTGSCIRSRQHRRVSTLRSLPVLLSCTCTAALTGFFLANVIFAGRHVDPPQPGLQVGGADQDAVAAAALWPQAGTGDEAVTAGGL